MALSLVNYIISKRFHINFILFLCASQLCKPGSIIEIRIVLWHTSLFTLDFSLIVLTFGFDKQTISCVYLVLTPNSRSVFRAGVSLNIHSFHSIPLHSLISSWSGIDRCQRIVGLCSQQYFQCRCNRSYYLNVKGGEKGLMLGGRNYWHARVH